MLSLFCFKKMSRRTNPISNRLYSSTDWSFLYASPLHKNSKVLHQTICLDIFLRIKLSQNKLFLKKRVAR